MTDRALGGFRGPLTEAGLDAAGVHADPVPLAGPAPQHGGGVGPRAEPPPHAHVTRTAARAPLGPRAPAAVH